MTNIIVFIAEKREFNLNFCLLTNLFDFLVSVWQADLDKQVVEANSCLKQSTDELEQCKVKTSPVE